MLLICVKLLFYIAINFRWALTMADMSSDYQELSVTGKVYDLPLPSQLCVAVVFLWFCTTLCPVEPFVKCDQLARFAA